MRAATTLAQAQLRDQGPQPYSLRGKKTYLRVTSGKDAFVHGETRSFVQGETNRQRTGTVAVTHPFHPWTSIPSPSPLGATLYDSPVRAAATSVIPSILNLTSSHTRDEVIAVNARHVRIFLIGQLDRVGAEGKGSASAWLRGASVSAA